MFLEGERAAPTTHDEVRLQVVMAVASPVCENFRGLGAKKTVYLVGSLQFLCRFCSKNLEEKGWSRQSMVALLCGVRISDQELDSFLPGDFTHDKKNSILPDLMVLVTLNGSFPKPKYTMILVIGTPKMGPPVLETPKQLQSRGLHLLLNVRRPLKTF